MKKYLYLFFVALFATMSVALTSCGDDDDEPSAGGKYSCNLTVNGSKFPSKTIAGEIWNHNGFDAITVWVNDATNENGYVIFEVTNVNAIDGINVSDDCSLDVDFGELFLMGGEVKSGSVTVSKIDRDAKTMTITFNNATFSSPMGDDATVNGTLTTPLNGADNKVKL